MDYEYSYAFWRRDFTLRSLEELRVNRCRADSLWRRIKKWSHFKENGIDI